MKGGKRERWGCDQNIYYITKRNTPAVAVARAVASADCCC